MMIFDTPVPGQRFLAPEVVQTSEMDCGPAALKSILEGFGISVSYGRLREACQTDVDGTSINTLEDIAVQLGLRAEQVMLPSDHLLLPEAQALPAIVVVRLPNGLLHFLVIWGQVGAFLQVMDPATGRRWPTWKKFLNELYIHTFPVPATAWRVWAASEGLLEPLRRRMKELELDQGRINALIQEALDDPGWRALAALDASTRMTAAIVRAKGIAPGEQAGKVLEKFFQLNRLAGADLAARAGGQEGTPPSGEPGEEEPAHDGLRIPLAYWSVLPRPLEEGESRPAPQDEELLLRGAVLVRILGRREAVEPALEGAPGEAARALPPDLEAALKEPAYRPEREIWKALREDGLLTPAILIVALFMSTLTVMIEALLFQGIIQIGQSLSVVSQRIGAVLILLSFVLVALLLEFPISSTVLRMGRRLETRLRITFLEKIPLLGDRYFRSRLTSDMTQRAHDLRQLRALPNLGMSMLRLTFQLILTMLGVIWLDPISAPLAILGTFGFMALSFFTRPILEERDLRMRTQTGALSRFYLDSLLGLVPAKTHGAERALRRQHEAQLFEWVRSGRDYYNVASFIQGIGALLYSGFAILIVMNYISKGGQPNEILLLFYWTLNLPTLGQALADRVQQYPMLRNRVLRLLEPLGAPDEEEAWRPTESPRQETAGPLESVVQPVEVSMENVWVQAGGHVILKEINLRARPGEHIAIVGRSGAGKSSLVGLLLGWHRPSQGQVYVDSAPLDGKRLQTLRRETAWVDPAVQLWNRSLYDNLRYGIESSDGGPLGTIVQEADLFSVLERLPDGLKTVLGEGGGLVSGGEGQRVRLGRALLRPETRLVILDEPFRGLDREKRRALLSQARQHWQNATLFCVTHDVSETLNFSRVLVIEDGQIVEDGPPGFWANQPSSRYYAMLEAEEQVRVSFWESAEWRRLKIVNGQLSLENEKKGDA